jgi:hypothetical protein
MIDSFPYDSWLGPDGKSLNENIAEFWTFGGADSVGTFTLTALGMLLMVAALIAWVWLEHKKLTAQAERLRAAGVLEVGGPEAGR